MTSLKRNTNETPATETVVETGLTSVPVETTAVVPVNASNSSDNYVADGDIVIPTLKLVHPLSPLAKDFEDGSVILNKECILSDGTAPVKLTVLSKKRYYREKTEFDSGIKPKLAYSEAELKAAGGTTEWLGDTPPTYDNVLDCVVVIESDKEDPALPFEFNGKYYAVALWSLHGKAFKKAGTLIQTSSMWSLKDGLSKGSWTLTTQKIKLKRGVAIDPILRAGPKNPPELVEFFSSLVGK